MKHNSLGTYEGTGDLVEMIIAESKNVYGWRPGRAALIHAIRDLRHPEAPYLTPDQFRVWVDEAKALIRARKLDFSSPRHVLGLTPEQYRRITSGKAGIEATGVRSRPIALACAHFQMGLPMPVEPDDHRALSAWFDACFSSSERVAEWMGVDSRTLSNRLRGYSLSGDTRQKQKVEAYWVRALSWLQIMGPVVPYGPKTPTPLWPGQNTEN